MITTRTINLLKSSDISDKSYEDKSSDSEYEKISNICERRCLLMPSSSNDKDESETEISTDGTILKKIKEGSVAGRLPVHSIFKDAPGPTLFTKRNI